MKNKKKVVILGLLGILGVVGGFGVFGGMKVDRVEVTVNNAVCVSEESVRVESGLLGVSIIMVDGEKIKSKLLDKFICIKDVKVERIFPGAVKLSVEGRQVLANVGTYKGERSVTALGFQNPESTPSSQSALLDWSSPQLSSQQFLADEGGVLFALFRGGDVPKLFLPEQTVKIGQRLDEGLFKKISTIFAETKKNEINISEAVVSEQDFLILQPKKVAFSLKRDIRKQLISLQLILEKSKIDESMIETIDLRFDKPVVKFLPKK